MRVGTRPQAKACRQLLLLDLEVKRTFRGYAKASTVGRSGETYLQLALVSHQKQFAFRDAYAIVKEIEGAMKFLGFPKDYTGLGEKGWALSLRPLSGEAVVLIDYKDN